MDLGEVQGQKKAMASMVEQITFFKTDLPSELLRMIQQRPQIAALLIETKDLVKAGFNGVDQQTIESTHSTYTNPIAGKYPDPFEGGNSLIQYIAKESGDEQLHLYGSNTVNYPLQISAYSPNYSIDLRSKCENYFKRELKLS